MFDHVITPFSTHPRHAENGLHDSEAVKPAEVSHHHFMCVRFAKPAEKDRYWRLLRARFELAYVALVVVEPGGQFLLAESCTDAHRAQDRTNTELAFHAHPPLQTGLPTVISRHPSIW